MSALAKTLTELDGLQTLVETLREGLEENATMARVALEAMAVALEEDESREYKEPKELVRLKFADRGQDVLKKLVRCGAITIDFAKCLTDFPEHLDLIYTIVDYTIRDNEAIRGASSLGRVAVVAHLLAARDESGRLCVDPSARSNEALFLASRHGHAEVVALLLAARDDSGRLRVDPSDNNDVFTYASHNGHVAVVELLLAARDDSGKLCIDPSINENEPIRWASFHGYIELVTLLLAARDDSGRLRVDPTDNDNQAIMWAAHNGHVAVVELLKEHGCVLPS